MPGLGALNKGNAGVSSVSCTSAGSCTAAGDYVDKARHRQGFVVAERRGVWGKAAALPGLAALGGGNVLQVSCGSEGNCAAGGFYSSQADNGLGWVAAEKNGIWGKAIAVMAPDKAGNAEVNSVSCGAAGSCVAGGGYIDNDAKVRGGWPLRRTVSGARRSGRPAWRR